MIILLLVLHFLSFINQKPQVRMVAGKQEKEKLTIIPKDLINNPIARLNTKLKEIENGVKGWLAKQSLPVETAIVTFSNAAQGALLGGIMGSLDIYTDAASVNPQALEPQPFQQAQALVGGPLVQARNLAVLMGVNAGIHCVMKRLTGKEDIQTSMVASFGSGVMFSLVNGVGAPNTAANAFTSGVFFALFSGGLYKVGEKFSNPPAEDVLYSETKSMLSRLGLQNYEKNFKKGLLTDRTLPLLTDSALQDVRIPTGPRLLIIDHVQRNKAKNGGEHRE